MSHNTYIIQDKLYIVRMEILIAFHYLRQHILSCAESKKFHTRYKRKKDKSYIFKLNLYVKLLKNNIIT